MKSPSRSRVLLVHPLGYQAEAAGRDIARKANLMPPLGLASLAAYLERRGIPVTLVDCNAHPDAVARLRERLATERPAVVGFSCTTASFLDGSRLAGMAKKELPGVTTVVGGPHASALGATVLAGYPSLDAVAVGEGEETLAELAEHGGRPEKIAGLLYRHADGTIVDNGRRAGQLELDSLPFPAYEKLDGYPAAYTLPIFSYPQAPTSSCISSRGCPYACSYCDRSVFGRTFRYNSADYLYAHMEYLHSRFGIRHLNFYDDQFTFNRERVEKLCRMLLDRPLGMTFNCAVRAEHVDPELLGLMRRAGCWMVSLGIETGDPQLLARHRRGAGLDRLAETIRQVKRAGLRVKGLLMVGLPGETEESIRRSMAYVDCLPIDEINVTKFTPFPGSPLYETIREQGTFDEVWEKMDCMHTLFVPHGMTRERLDRLHQLFYRRHFSKSRVLAGYLSMLWRSPDSWRRFAGDFWSYLAFARSERRFGKE